MNCIVSIWKFGWTYLLSTHYLLAIKHYSTQRPTLFCQTFQQMCVPSCTFYLLATKHYSRDVFISSPWKTCSTLDPPSFLACSTESIWSLNRSLVSITACPASASADSRSCCTCCQHIWVKAFHFHWERFIVAQWSVNQILLQHLYPTHRPTSAFS